MSNSSSCLGIAATAGAGFIEAPGPDAENIDFNPPVTRSAHTVANDRICSLREVKSLTGNPSTSSIYRWIDQGIFPKQRRVGINRVGWLYSEVMEFVSQCEAA